MNQNKRGISEMVSYALLIVIAVGLAVGVFVYLKGYVPGDKRIECPSDVTLGINYLNCSYADKIVMIDFQNNGLFNVSGAFIRMGNESRKVKFQLNKAGSVYVFNNSDLAPGQDFIYVANLSVQNVITYSGRYGVDVQPAVKTNNGLAVCDVNTYVVMCS